VAGAPESPRAGGAPETPPWSPAIRVQASGVATARGERRGGDAGDAWYSGGGEDVWGGPPPSWVVDREEGGRAGLGDVGGEGDAGGGGVAARGGRVEERRRSEAREDWELAAALMAPEEPQRWLAAWRLARDMEAGPQGAGWGIGWDEAGAADLGEAEALCVAALEGIAAAGDAAGGGGGGGGGGDKPAGARAAGVMLAASRGQAALGGVLALQGRLQEALESYQLALRLHADAPTAPPSAADWGSGAAGRGLALVRAKVAVGVVHERLGQVGS